MPGPGLPLDIDLDLVTALVEESLPWLQAWCALVAAIAFVICAASVRNWLRARRSPLRRLTRRPVRRSLSGGG